MPVNIFVSLPHEHDGIVNYALSLLRAAANPDIDRIFCHADTNTTLLQRHARNLLHGRDSRHDNVLDVTNWVEQQLEAETGYLHIYGRFFVADYEIPPSAARMENFWQLIWLYFRGMDPRIIFIDYGEALGGSRRHCAHVVRERMMQDGEDETRAAVAANRYFGDWSFSIEEAVSQARAIFGVQRVKVINFDSYIRINEVFLELMNAICDGRPSADVLGSMDKGALRQAVAALRRKMREVLAAEVEKASAKRSMAKLAVLPAPFATDASPFAGRPA